MPLLTEEFAAALFAEIDGFCAATGDSGVALRMDHLFKSPWLDALLRPAASEAAGADGFSGMLVKAMRYVAPAPGRAEKADWPAHCDGDLATINICLGNAFEGGLLRVMSYDAQGMERPEAEIEHRQVGCALVHSGMQRHSVTPVTAGTRIVLIVKVY